VTTSVRRNVVGDDDSHQRRVTRIRSQCRLRESNIFPTDVFVFTRSPKRKLGTVMSYSSEDVVRSVPPFHLQQSQVNRMKSFVVREDNGNAKRLLRNAYDVTKKGR
jgi:hypothetical protein